MRHVLSTAVLIVAAALLVCLPGAYWAYQYGIRTNFAVVVEDQVYRAGTGEFFRIPPGTKHRFAAERLAAQLTEFSSHHDDDDVVRHEPSGPITEELIARAES